MLEDRVVIVKGVYVNLSANTATSLTGSAFFCWGQYLKAGGEVAQVGGTWQQMSDQGIRERWLLGHTLVVNPAVGLAANTDVHTPQSWLWSKPMQLAAM